MTIIKSIFTISVRLGILIFLLASYPIVHAQEKLEINFEEIHNKLKEKLKDESMRSLPKQIFLEVNIFEVLVNNSYDIGFVYDILGEVAEFNGTNPNGENVLESDLSVLGFANRNEQLPAGANIVASVMDGDEGEIRATIQALAEDQILKVHANPTLLTLNSVPVRLESGEDIPFLSRKIAGESETVASEFSNTGVLLNITPEVVYFETDLERKRPFILVTIRAEFSTVSRFREEQGFIQPIIDTRQTQTSVYLKEKSRVLIGSLFRDRLENRERGIPVIKDIPLLGRLFRSTSNESRVSHLFVMIRPVILDIWGDSALEESTLEYSRNLRNILDKRADEVGSQNDPIFKQFREIFLDRSSIE